MIIKIIFAISKKKEDGKQMIKCSFCSEDQSAAEIGAHLMQCGNKTEQCPNCEKYIRRGILAYHDQNNCANVEDFEDKMNRPVAVNHDASSTSKQYDRNFPTRYFDKLRNSAQQPPSKFAPRGKKQIEMIACDCCCLAYYPMTSSSIF